MVRWAWRLFRREWRRQALVLALLIVAVAATTVGPRSRPTAGTTEGDPTFGTAEHHRRHPRLRTHLAARHRRALADRFGTVDVIAHQTVAVPGSVTPST